MTHDEIVAEIQARAEIRGVLSHYCRSALRCTGAPGLPDVLLAGRNGIAWIEVKTAGDRMRPDQTRWKYVLKASGQICEVMTERDLAPGGAVDMMFSFIATGDAARLAQGLGNCTRSAGPGS